MKTHASINRRRFLATSATLAAGAVTPSQSVRAESGKAREAEEPVLGPRNRVPKEVDVLVAGGGPAGIGAAIAAARAGAKTLLVERHGFLGGVASYGLGMPMNQMRPGGKPRGIVHELLIRRLRQFGPEAGNVIGHALVCNVEYLKVAIMDVLEYVGCDYLLHTRIADSVVERDRVNGVVVVTKEGLVKIRARVAVDATGDADVSYYAGAETMKGEDGQGPLSPMTLLLLIANVDVEGARRFARRGGLRQLLDRAREKYPLLPERMGFELGPHPLKNCLVINHSGTKLAGLHDGTSLRDMTHAEEYCRRQAIQIVRALREFGGEPFANMQLAATGPQVGVRETRRVKGLYVLTEEDAKAGRHFEDVVAWRSGFLDVGWVRFEKMQVHDVPYRSLLPEKMDGLLVAGRCISATHVGASAGKSMGNCVATGHAAGLAAAKAVAQRKQPRELSVREIQQALEKDGVDLRRDAA